MFCFVEFACEGALVLQMVETSVSLFVKYVRNIWITEGRNKEEILK
jgi:hypothetical protein